MQIKIDFQLSCQLGVVERTIFRLVLNGFTNAEEIVSALPIFSDAVIANGIKYLVNRQILSANIDSGRLSLTDPLVAIIDMCMENSYEINVPSELEDNIRNLGLLISSIADEESTSLKKAILSELLPRVKLDMYVDSIDFVIYGDRGGQCE